MMMFPFSIMNRACRVEYKTVIIEIKEVITQSFVAQRRTSIALLYELQARTFHRAVCGVPL